MATHSDTIPGKTAQVFNIQHYSVNDGPGIRTTVFFKGCPLSCVWCSNPESQRAAPELIYHTNLCRRCYRCVAVCSHDANTVDDAGNLVIDRARCQGTGKCAAVCPAEARNVAGREMGLDEVLGEVTADEPFYGNSGGGVTASGGEPLQQPRFLKSLFEACRRAGIHTTLDTCGQADWDVLADILEQTDLVYYDIKHMDASKHRRLTGVDNALILENAARIAGSGVPLVLRLPLIPGLNDSTANLRTTADFARRVSAVRLDIVPFHQFGGSKYSGLGREYELANRAACAEARVDEVRQICATGGLSVRAA